MDSSTLASLSGIRILVIEDEYFLAKELADWLSDEGAIVVGPASTVETAHALIDRDAPDCAVLDMNLRGASGAALARRLDDDGIRYLVLSGYDAAALPAGVQDAPYLAKPARPQAITEAMMKLIGPR